ncbi:Acetyltransferase (GNAT) family protein [Clostridium amylolyticum]|uniref:Acetyltransferase (GNAT) family protein n=1 Tax=Clostridium amylolyticum TaxID=1121298 RepID=A0A1M6FPL6_9CLOT|nr:GNAT family N-acetyltransferase [Clostridium amylolyticum]SHI99671.1 Acetyltransferase (GNAT) family protein [Clostridium amylolyticum]
MFRKAVIEDIEEIMNIVQGAVAKMNELGNDQWGEDYPKAQDYLKDIKEGTLFVYCQGNDILGVICINEDEAPEYSDVSWRINAKALVIHRIAVKVHSQGKGIAYKLLGFAEDLARETGINYIRTDTYTKNNGAQRLFLKSGYEFRGVIHFTRRPEDFYCYDKVL